MSETITTLCHLWRLRRRDGVELGFTDHDRDVTVGAAVFHASSGLGRAEIDQSAGLAVDNSEAWGALSHDLIRAEDVLAGRYDHAAVTLWQVDWTKAADLDLRQAMVLFRGHLGEVAQKGQMFRAEMRGLSDLLNQPVGFAYGRQCSAVLGDQRCKVALDDPRWQAEVVLATPPEAEGRRLTLAGAAGYAAGWFAQGALEVCDGPSRGLSAMIREDRLGADGLRRVELWQGLVAPLEVGVGLRLRAGCDSRLATCRVKFENLLNFRGFPHLPSEDWLSAYPRSDRAATGGRLGYDDGDGL